MSKSNRQENLTGIGAILSGLWTEEQHLAALACCYVFHHTGFEGPQIECEDCLRYASVRVIEAVRWKDFRFGWERV